MLDPHDRDAARANAADDVDEFLRLGVGQAAADFVKQQDRWTGGERARKLQAFAVHQAECLGFAVGEAEHA